MLKNTEGLVLRNIKYGETSIISTLYTKDFGLQAYLIRGARSNKKTGIKANYFQLGQFLDITVYHKPGKNLQYIREVKLNASHAIQSQNIVKQSIVQFCSELVLRCVKEEEENNALYTFLSNFMRQLKELPKEKLGLAPIQFALQFAAHIGFEINNNYSTERSHFDALHGEFCAEISNNSYCSKKEPSALLHACLEQKASDKTKFSIREQTLHDLLRFLKLHNEQMGEMKSVEILHQILHD